MPSSFCSPRVGLPTDWAEASRPESCLFLTEVPREVRDQIYAHLLPPASHVTLIPSSKQANPKFKIYLHDPQKKWHIYPEDERVWIAIRQTCSKVYDETKELFWSRYTFSFTSNLWNEGGQWTNRILHHGYIAGLQDNLQRIELEFPLLEHMDQHAFVSGIFRFLVNDCKNLKSITLRNNPYVSPTPADPRQKDDNWLDASYYKDKDIWARRGKSYYVEGELSPLGITGIFGRYVANNPKVERKMIFDIGPEAYTVKYGWWCFDSESSQKLNRWLHILHRFWGGELLVNGVLVRNGEEHLQRVVVGVGHDLPVPEFWSRWQSLRPQRKTVTSLIAGFEPVENAEEEKEYLGRFVVIWDGDISTGVYEI